MNVLDHGQVELLDSMGNDDRIVAAARASFNQTSKGPEADAKLIRYLLTNQHTSPFEHVHFTFFVRCPIFVARQWMRHRTWSFSEQSGRYSELSPDFYTPVPGRIRRQDQVNKQGTSAEPLPAQTQAWANEVMSAVMADMFEYYKALLHAGVSRELARIILPVATYTQFFATVDLHNFLKFCALRQDHHAQEEIRVYAEAMMQLVQPIVPVTIAAWKELRG